MGGHKVSPGISTRMVYARSNKPPPSHHSKHVKSSHRHHHAAPHSTRDGDELLEDEVYLDSLSDHVVGPNPDTVDLHALSGRVQNVLTKGPFHSSEPQRSTSSQLSLPPSSTRVLLQVSSPPCFFVKVPTSFPSQAPFFNFSRETGAI